MDARKSHFTPKTPDQLCANYTRHLMCFARNGSIQRSPHPCVHVVVRSLMKLYNPHALDLTIANTWVRSSS